MKNSNRKSSIKNSNYNASDIEVLEGLEPVRKRPGMYIGGCDQNAMHHMFCEVLDNSMDEAVAGYATCIEIEISSSGIISVADNGRGIPTDQHPKFPGKSALEVILTTLHSGGKFNTNVYATSGGLHGVGVSVVNALSEHFIAEVKRGGFVYRQEYAKGIPLNEIEKLKASKALACGIAGRAGTKISFKPDPEIFGNAMFDPIKLYSIANSKAYLYKGVTIVWRYNNYNVDDASEKLPPKFAEIHYANGIKDYVSRLVPKSVRLTEKIFYAEAEIEAPKGKVECAFAFNAVKDSNKHRYYCNTIHSPLGGTHENGFRAMIVKALKSYANFVNYKYFDKVTADDIMEDITLVLSIFIPHPSFQGQTKEKLLSKEAAKLVELALKDRVEHMLINAPQVSKMLLDQVFENANERLRRKVSREIQRKNPLQRLRLPGKLTDCNGSNIEDTELLLVEGESAGGTTKQARDRRTQAVLPLRGKFLNVVSNSDAKIDGNQEVSDLVTALGCGMGRNFDITKLRYGKVIIMTDADVDGAHICTLILTFFYIKMNQLLQDGHVYLVKSPLYRITCGGQQHYVYSDEEKLQLLQKLPKNSTIEISRFKGLGEMTAKQLKETTMHKGSRTLYKVLLPNDEESSADTQNLVTSLMGKKPELRFQFIRENANFESELDN